MPTRTNKPLSGKKVEGELGSNETWTIVTGTLSQQPGRPSKTKSLFKSIGEKIPIEFIKDVREYLDRAKIVANGVYIAHDSMGYPRYIGHGQIFARLRSIFNQNTLELRYFSFFVIEDKIHEMEIETIMIRAAGPPLHFNSRKVRNDIQAGNVLDFEAGTTYVERQYKKKRKANRED